jgi:hypothetical protein
LLARRLAPTGVEAFFILVALSAVLLLKLVY